MFQVAVSHQTGRVDEEHRLPRARFLRFFAKRPAATVLFEACGSAHHWARTLEQLGHTVRLLPPHETRRYVRRNKTDRADAKALLEAARNEEIHPVPVKSVAQHTKAAINDVILRGRRVGCPLIATDGFEYYVGVMVRLLGSACVYGQVLKTRRNNRVVRVERRVKIGTASRLNAALLASEDSETLTTSFIERLNLTIRQGSAYLRRRSPCHARGVDQLRGHVELLRCYYEFHSAAPGVEVRARDQDAGDAGRSGEPALGVARHLHGGRSHATYLSGRRARIRDRPAHGI